MKTITTKRKNCSFLSLLFLLAILNFSCKKIVSVDPPVSKLVTSTVFNNNASATSAVIGLYSQLQTNQQYNAYVVSLYTGYSSDELQNFSPVQTLIEFYSNSLNATDNINNSDLWSIAYNYIYQTNAILDGLGNSSGISPMVKQQLTGEAKFLRAFFYFYLVNLYGDVPLALTPNYQINASLSRSSTDLVYSQIISDLTAAHELLNSDYVDASDTTKTLNRIRPNKWAASALLARVYLYIGDYDHAQTLATSVINNSNEYSLDTNLDDVFLANSTEAIWQLAIPLPANGNTIEGANYILTGAPSGGSATNCSAISPFLLHAFESNDQRFIHWISSVNVDTSIYYFPFKYKIGNGISTITEYSMVLRLAEQYLIRSEAEANQLNLNSAITDLNIIRHRAGLSNYGGAMNKESVLSAILHERQVELFTEWGHRWFDLKRTGSLSKIMGRPGMVCQSKGGIWNENWKFYPIPLTDIIADHKLTQNPGY